MYNNKMEPNSVFMNPELQLNNMLANVSQQLPNDKLQKVSEILNSGLATEMLLRHLGFFDGLSKAGSKVVNTVKQVAPEVGEKLESIGDSLKSGAQSLIERGKSVIQSLVKPSPDESFDTASMRGGLEGANPIDEPLNLPEFNPGMLSQTSENFVNTASRLRQGIQDAMTQGENTVNEVESVGQQVVENVSDKVASGIQKASGVISDLEEGAEGIPGIGEFLEGGLAIAGLATSFASIFEKEKPQIPSYTGFQEGL